MSLAKNSILYLISTICLKAVGFLLLPLYTHLVSPTEYGYVYVVSAFQTFMGLFLTLSMHGAIGRFYFECKDLDDVKQMYSQQVTTITCSSTILALLMLFFREYVSDVIGLPEKYYILAILISYFSLFYNLIIALLYAMEKAVKISITSVVIGSLTIIMQLAMVLTLQDKALALILAMLFSALLTFVIFIVYSLPYFVRPKYKKQELLKYYKYSISQLPSDVSGWFVAASDRLLLNSIQGASSAGVYGMGNTLGQIAEQKAGIMKEGCPVVTAGQMPEAFAVVQKAADKKHCPLRVADPARISHVKCGTGRYLERQRFDYKCEDETVLKNLEINLLVSSLM